MNIIHNSAQKFIPNTIFAHSLDHQHDYSHDHTNPPTNKNKENISASLKKVMTSQQPIMFQDKTNLQAQYGSRGTEKQGHTTNLTPKKVNIRSNITDESLDQISLVPLDENDNLRKPKHKKKVSPRKKNLQQLFDEITEKPDNDCIFVENQIRNNQHETKNSSQDFESCAKTDSKRKITSKQSQGKQVMQEEASEQEEAQKNNKLFKINKFQFLHNELNLDSSSDEQGQQQAKDVRGSSSSQNDEEKIDFVVPKIRSRNNFFIKKEDLNLDSSDESQQQQKEDQSFKQISQKTNSANDQVKENNQNISPQASSSRTINVTDFRRQFVNSNEEYLKKPLPEGVTIDLIIKRDKTKRNSDYIEYSLYDAKTLRMIVVVVKKSGLHEIMAKKNVEDPKAHPDVKYLTAKLQSNFLGSEFTLKYVPKLNLPPAKSSKGLELEEIAATVSYQTNILGFKGPRKMSVYIPENQSVKYYGDKSLEHHYSKKCNHRIEKYVNKQAKWNKEVQSYVLNLKGKARLSSVKNFVIVKDEKGQQHEDDKSFVIFGKISKEIFNLSVSGPFSIIQGLSLALSTFERKIICE